MHFLFSASSSRAHPLEQPPVGWLLFCAAVVLSFVVLLITALSIGRNEAAMASLLAEKGSALIRAFEGGLRTGMRSQVGVRLQSMLEEMVGPDILFATVVMPDGTIIAHSTPERLGEMLEIEGREADSQSIRELLDSAEGDEVHWNIMRMEGKRVFVVYRDFLPGARPHRGHLGGGHGLGRGPGPTPKGPRNIQKILPPPMIFLGLDVTPFENTRRQDRTHMLAMAGGMVLVGFACLLALYYAQRARESRRRQKLAEGQVRLLEEEVRRKEKLAAIGNLAAGVAHEIRNPLSSIKGYATYFSQRFPEASEDREAAHVMVREVDRLNRVITDLIGLSRPTDVHMTPTDILPVINHAIRLLRQDAENRHVRLHLDAPATLPLVPLDSDRFGQALLNVCLNAIEAMPDGGELTISLKALGAKRVRIDIRDTGTGILPDHLAHIFDPYFTTKGHGTGLGLPTVHKIVEAHGGEVTVSSRHKSRGGASGTLFRIILPTAPKARGSA